MIKLAHSLAFAFFLINLQGVEAYYGGMLKRPSTSSGAIVVVNCQNRIAHDLIVQCADRFESDLSMQTFVKKGSFAITNDIPPASAYLYVIDDKTYPTLLSAPEDRWALVNVAKLDDSNSNLEKARFEKETTRGFALLGGAFMSQFPNPIVGAITKTSELDSIEVNSLPLDSKIRMANYLECYGIMQYEAVSYLDACQEGWAPAPTNDVQRKIWNQVHEIPTDPLKITFDPKTDTK